MNGNRDSTMGTNGTPGLKCEMITVPVMMIMTTTTTTRMMVMVMMRTMMMNVGMTSDCGA